jgi:leucyl-tRNA---protein transferase
MTTIGPFFGFGGLTSGLIAFGRPERRPPSARIRARSAADVYAVHRLDQCPFRACPTHVFPRRCASIAAARAWLGGGLPCFRSWAMNERTDRGQDDADDASRSRNDLRDLRLYHTADHVCGYWPEQQARDLVLDPADPRLAQAYPLALGWGFRRSGRLIYRPHCRACADCIAVRVPVEAFRPDRSQRRCLARNADLDVRIAPAARDDAHLELYRRYLAARHPGGGMDEHDAADFDQFLIGAWEQTRFLEIHERGDSGSSTLLAVAVTDAVGDALSAVYTFYDPRVSERGLGTLAILEQIRWAQREGLRHLYLGYWIEGHRKMDYKRKFRPLEWYDGRSWRAFETP